MAQELNLTYGFSYDNLKVLHGGYNKWEQQNQADRVIYPIEP